MAAEQKISVIIPCYNAIHTIDRCLETVTNQTIGISNMEIILVNDASTDDTLVYLQRWEKQFPDNVLVVTYEENLHQGGARNIGMQYASGEYIGFVDSDDWIELDMYETLYSIAKEGDYDVVRGKLIREHFPGELAISQEEPQNHSYQFEKTDGFYRNIVTEVGQYGEYSNIVTAIYRRSIVIENDVWFPERVYYEDNYWGTMMDLYTSSLYIWDHIVYHYYVNMNSVSTMQNAPHHFDRLVVELSKLEEYRRLGLMKTRKDEIEWEFLKLFYLNTMYIAFVRFDDIPTILPEVLKTVKKEFPDYAKNPYLYRCNQREHLLLSLLEIPGEISMDDWRRIKIAYLESMQ